MAFPGTELLEVAPTVGPVVASGGGYVWAVGDGEVAIMNTSTGDALLYSHGGSTRYRADYGNSYFSNDYLAGAGRYTSSQGAWFTLTSGYLLGVSTTGITVGKSVSGLGGHTGSPYYAYWGPVSMTIVDDVLWGVWMRNSDYSYRYASYNLTTDTAGSYSAGSFTSGFGALGSYMYGTSGTTVTQYDKTGTATGSTWTVPLAPTSSASEPDGNKIWWKSAGGMVWCDPVAGTVGGVAATPAWSAPNGRRPVILSGVAYWIKGDHQSMTAFNLANGQWKDDDLVTIRGWRIGIGVGNGKLWIPSAVTPP